MALAHGAFSDRWEARKRRAARATHRTAAHHSSAPAAAPPVAAPRANTWRYIAADKRDLRIDLLRGFAVFAMVIDHVGGMSWLYNVSGGNRFFVSAAEGFVFLSGLTVGIVYGGLAITQGLRPAIGKLLGRAWLLYTLAVWLTLGFALTATVLDNPIGLPFATAPARFIFEVVTLQRTFYLADVLLVYLFAMLAATGALALLRRGLWWVVATLSTGLWTAFQFRPDLVQVPWRIADNPVFSFAPWQLLFFSAMIIGYHRQWLSEHILARIPASPLRDGYVLPLGAAVGGLVWLSATNATAFAPLVPGGNTAALLDDWFLKSQLPLPRILAACVVFAFAWALVTRCWRPIRAAFGPFLLTLGQGALYAYAAHLFLSALVYFLATEIIGTGPGGSYPSLHPGINTAFQVGTLAILWALTRVHFLQGVVAPLGRSPFVRVQGRITIRPSEPLLAIAVVALVTMAYSLPISSTARAAKATTTPVAASTGSTSATNSAAAPVSTVTAPRTIAGAAAGSGALAPASTVTAPRSIGGAAAGSGNAAAPVSTVTAPRAIGGAAAGSANTAAPVSTVTAPRNVAGSAAGSGTAASAVPSTAPANDPVAAAASPAANAAAAAAAVLTTTGPAAPTKAAGYLRDASFYSEALGREMPYGIYFPPGYDADNTRYPVLYMLHGAGGHYSEWVGYGLADSAERLIQGGRITPMIIVFPQGDESYFVNHATDGERWGDYIVTDLIAHIDGTYRTNATREARAIGGLSMGGFAALSLGLSHPELFAAIGAHSPALRTQAEASGFLGDPSYYATIDPMVLAETIDPTKAPRIWIDVGITDNWASRTTALKDELRARNILPEYSENTGGHDGQYWQQNGTRYLRFYSSAFNPPPATTP